MDAYKVVGLIVNFEGLSGEEIRNHIENVRFPNDCISFRTLSIDYRDIGEWSDEHPLNFETTLLPYYNKNFKEPDNELLENALIDLLDGNADWYEIKSRTGLSDERCKEIEDLFYKILQKRNR